MKNDLISANVKVKHKVENVRKNTAINLNLIHE